MAKSDPYQQRLVAQGANADVSEELLGSGEGGEYVDSLNGRTTSSEGQSGAWSKIKGEEILNDAIENACKGSLGINFANYRCIGKAKVNTHRVEFWADKTGVEYPYIRIDGVISLYSGDLPIDVNHPLQLDVNENCKGGDLYITDNNYQPIFLNVEDMMKNNGLLGGTCTEKYYTNYNHGEHVLSLGTALDRPVFVGLVNVGAGGGLDVGSYQYAIRYVSTAGDRTRFSVSTPLIPVPQEGFTTVNDLLVVGATGQSPQYPGIKSYGATAAPGAPYGQYGIRIRYRVNNFLNYDSIEIRRVAYIAGAGDAVVPTPEIVARVTINPQEVSVREHLDIESTNLADPITDDEDTEVMSAIDRAKAIRYFHQRLYLMNIKYASRDMEGRVTFSQSSNGNEMYPMIHKLGIYGYNDPYNNVYYKSLMRGERYGWALTGYDYMGQNTFSEPVTNCTNVLMPNRRESTSADTTALSKTVHLGVSKAANINGVAGDTHEVFDLTNNVAKTDQCTYKNIMEAGFGFGKPTPLLFNSNCNPTQPPGAMYTPNDVGYKPFAPVAQDDLQVDGHNYMINTKVEEGANPSPNTNYAPQGFAPNYYALGMALDGVATYPSWMRSFSINRSRPAGRVVCQGIGFYALTSADKGGGAGTTKEMNKFWFFSVDIEKGIVDPSPILASPPSYEAEIVSPLGFFTEVYDGDQAVNGSRGIDMVSYARILRETGNINHGQAISEVGVNDGGGGNGYVAYGKWRNPAMPGGIYAGCVQPAAIGMTGFSSVPEGRGDYYLMTLNKDVYLHPTSNSQYSYDDVNVKQWHEPIYIVNIILSGAQVPDQDVNEFTESAHYQKIESIIGRSDGTVNQSFQLVDERWEDCIPNTHDPNKANLNTYVTIQDENGVRFRWQDITFKNAGQIVAIKAALAPGEGVYTHTNTQDRFYSIDFDDADYTPPENSLIIVIYDNSIPIRIFTGDTVIGESIFSPVDREFTNGGDPIDMTYPNYFSLSVGFPYNGYKINDRVYVINQTTGLNRIQTDNWVRFTDLFFQKSYIRQMCCVASIESRAHTPYNYNFSAGTNDQVFPLVNYIMRPHRWDIVAAPNNYINNNIFVGYETDYDQEYDNWNYGGFKFLPLTNFDYSAYPNTREFSTKPAVGFEETLEFCTRVTWSVTRPVNIQDSPTVRTFPATNVFDISDNHGEIKYAYSESTGRGDNLYAFTDSGICLLLTDKRTLHEIAGNELATMAATGAEGVLQQIWLHDTGMTDEMWRSAAEGKVYLEGGAKKEGIYFANYDSVFQFSENNLRDLGRENYHTVVYNRHLRHVLTGLSTNLTGFFDTLHGEYALCFRDETRTIDLTRNVGITNLVFIGTETVLYLTTTVAGKIVRAPFTPTTFIVGNKSNLYSITVIDPYSGNTIKVLDPMTCWQFVLGGTINDPTLPAPIGDWTITAVQCESMPSGGLVWSEKAQHWMGKYEYSFDQFLSFNNKAYGMKDGKTYLLNTGYVLNGIPVNGYVVQAFSPERSKDKEFVRMRISSDNKPTSVELFDNKTGYFDTDIQSIITAAEFKDYNGWEAYIPREMAAPYDRLQGRVVLCKIINNLEEEFTVVEVGVKYKIIK